MADTKSAEDLQVEYWKEPITRAEAQTVFDQQAAALNQLRAQVGFLAIAVRFVAERAGVSPEEIQVYAEQKMAEMKALAEAAGNAEQSSVVAAN